MKKVTLKSITMRNFRGEKDRTTTFNDGETTIKGENGLGKSRHFDAFVWLLFGKDTKDRKDYNIKTMINGKPLEKVNTEVSAILDVNGETIALRRVYAEKWVKPRGQVEERFDGHEHEVYWNDVPLKVGEYNSRINSIINDSVFKMITNPMFFANMKWQEQREVLFQLAGTITDHEIAALKPEYAALLDKISGKSMADFKREIAAKKKKLKDELDTIQPRIDQTHKLMPETSDFDILEVEIESLEKQIEDIDKAISDKTTAIRRQYDGVQKKQSEINDLKRKRQTILNEAKMAAKESAFEANALRRNLENNIQSLENEISFDERSIKVSENELDSLKGKLTARHKEMETLRQSWHTENAKEYASDDICHECGQLLPEERRENARQNFVKSKATKLAQITKNGKVLSNEAEQFEQDITKAENSLKTAKNNLQSKRENLDSLKGQLKEMAVVEEREVNPDEFPEYVELTNQIKALEETLEDGTETIDTSEFQSQKKELSTKRDSVKSELKNRDLIDQYNTEINNLQVKGKKLAQQIADVEREEYTIQEFAKTRIVESERRINGLFSMVTFKLLDRTIDGNESETCIPLVDGVPFGTANTAGQVNAGLDIINALVRFHSVSAPIFIDGRESVNRLIKTESQIINLVVSHDKQLIIN